MTRGDEKWEVSDKELDKLPEELRPPVEHMLGPGPFPFPMMLGGMPYGFNMPGIRIEGMPNGDFHPGPFGGPPPRDGEHGPPPHDGTPRPRDGDGPPPPGGPQPPHCPGFSGGFQPPMMPGQVPPELMDRLDRLDRRLEMLQDDLRRLQDGGPGGIPRMRPHDGKGPDGPPPRDDQHGGPPRDDRVDGPPGMHGGPPPADHDHHGPPPRDDNDHGPPGGPHDPPPGDQ